MTFDGRIESSVTVPAGVTISATNSGGGPTSVPLTAATYASMTALLAHVVAQLNATRTPATWTGSISTGASGTGKVSLNWTGAGTYSIAWTNTTIRDLLGFTADLAGVTQGVASVGTKQCRGLWIPDSPITALGDPRSAPKRSDRRGMTTPNGVVYTHVGNTLYRLRGVRYTHVPLSRIWEQNAAIPNASLETFWNETQLGQSSSWFSPGMKLQIWDHTGQLVGSNANAGAGLAGWYISTPFELDDLPLAITGWTGLFAVALGDLVSDS